MKIQKSPLFLVALAFAAGIALSAILPSPGFWGLALVISATLGTHFASRKRIQPVLQNLFLGLLALCFVFSGWVMGEISAVIPNDDPSQQIGQTVATTGYVAEEVRETKSGFRTVFQCESPIVGKVLLYLPKSATSVHVNDRLQLELDIDQLSQAHPAYANYLHHQGIHASARASAVSVIGRETGIMATFADLRSAIANQMKSVFPDPTTAGLSNAMLLGDRSDLDQELKKSFAATGLSHIVAISGMNFAIIYLVLCLLLKPLLYLEYGRQIRSLLVVPTLVFFALLAGANPAIVRAAIMLSILDLGQAFWNKSNSLNALATSALLFLAFDPQSLFSPDFQLSYAAVLGILGLQNPILHYFHKRMKWMPKAISSAMAVTLAAQAATTPLVAWHFQSFPTYFLLANLIVLPIVTLVVQIGFAGFLIAWIPGVAEMWGGIMDFMLWAITWLANFMSQLPGATISAIAWDQVGIWVFSGQVLLFLAVLEWRFVLRAWAYLRNRKHPQAYQAARTGLGIRSLAAPALLAWVLLGFLL